ncbi:MAG: O-antigen ligase family protein [Candidatus Taylorbacteria bacterium]
MSIKKIAHYTSIVALFLVPLFPLIIANTYFFPFITGKAFYFRILVEIAFAAWIILAFLDAKYRPKLTAMNVAVTLFAVIALVADLLGVNPIRSMWSNFERMEGWITVIHLWAFYITASSLFGSGAEARKLWHRWLNVTTVVATFISLYGLGQLFGWFAIHQSAARLDATIGNAAYLGIYIVIHMFILAYLYFSVRQSEFAGKQILQWLYPILFVLFGVIALETQTRAAVIGLAGGMFMGLLIYAVFAKRESKKSRWITGGIVIGLIVLAGIFYIERKQPFFANSPIFGRLASLSLEQFKGEGRASIWPMAIKGALERPILGWGQENFNYIFNANYAPAMYGQEQWFDRAHSVFIDWFVASGFVGLFAYLAMFILSIILIWRSDISVAKKSALTGLIIAYGINNLAVFDNLASYVFFFAILGLVNSFNKGKDIKILGTNPVRSDAVEYIVAPIVIIVLIGVIYFFSYRPIQANTRLIAALQSCGSVKADAALFEKALAVNTYVANQEIREQLLSCAGQIVPNAKVPMPTREAFFTLTSKEIDAQIASNPKDARAYVLGGSFMNSIGQSDQAISMLEKARELSPTKQSILISLGDAYLQTSKNDMALSLFKQAYESETDNASAKFAYAVGMVVAGKEAEAKTMFNNDTTIFESAQMARVYTSMKQYTKAIDILKKLSAASPKDIDTLGLLAQTQYTAGLKDAAVKTLESIAAEKPEYKVQIDATIKQIREGK